MKKIIFTVLIAAIIIPNISFAHPGHTDAYGCHTCRTNCAKWGLASGEYHCHASKGVPQPKEPVKSTLGKTGTGSTKPAPEYKTPKAVKAATVAKEATTPAPVKTADPAKKKGFWATLFGKE